MAADKTKIEAYFKHVVQEYNCADIRELLKRKLDQAGPLLACTVNGIDTVGGMMVGAAYTLFRMRRGLFDGLRRAISDLKVTAAQMQQTSRTEQYMSSKVVFSLIGVMFLAI